MAKKYVIAITSILKPVDDTRNYEKIAQSLDKKGEYDIYLFGKYVSNIPTSHNNIRLFPLVINKRFSLNRLLAPWKTFIKLIKVKPDVIIVNTHELLIVTTLYKILFGNRLLYDIQENYFLNITSTNAFPSWLKYIIAAYVRLKEKLLARFIDHFILAEACYADELSFVKDHYTILENKYLPVPTPYDEIRPVPDKTSLVYTGTIAEAYGIFDAISFVKQLSAKTDIHLTIIGYCPNRVTLNKLLDTIKDKPYITLIGGDTLVPHNQIISYIQSAEFALLPYLINAYYSNRIPTKIYECLALKTPMLIRQNPSWQDIFDQVNAFLFTDFDHVDNQLIDQLHNGEFYTIKNFPRPFWNFDSDKLIAIVKAQTNHF